MIFGNYFRPRQQRDRFPPIGDATSPRLLLSTSTVCTVRFLYILGRVRTPLHGSETSCKKNPTGQKHTARGRIGLDSTNISSVRTFVDRHSHTHSHTHTHSHSHNHNHSHNQWYFPTMSQICTTTCCTNCRSIHLFNTTQSGNEPTSVERSTSHVVSPDFFFLYEHPMVSAYGSKITHDRTCTSTPPICLATIPAYITTTLVPVMRSLVHLYTFILHKRRHLVAARFSLAHLSAGRAFPPFRVFSAARNFITKT